MQDIEKNWDFCFNPAMLDRLLLSISKDKTLKIYYKDAVDFVDYLKKCNDISIKYVYYDGVFKRHVKVDDYYNRYTPKYRRKIYAKLKTLERWTKEHFSGFVTLLTLTTYQRNRTISECLDNLQSENLVNIRNIVHFLIFRISRSSCMSYRLNIRV